MSTLRTKGPSGRRMTVTAPTGGYSGGDLVPIRTGVTGCCGIAIDDIAAAETGPVEYGHQVEVAKNTGTGESFAVGALVYHDASTGLATATATGNDLAGTATAAAGTSASVVWVQLGDLTHPA